MTVQRSQDDKVTTIHCFFAFWLSGRYDGKKDLSFVVVFDTTCCFGTESIERLPQWCHSFDGRAFCTPRRVHPLFSRRASRSHVGFLSVKYGESIVDFRCTLLFRTLNALFTPRKFHSIQQLRFHVQRDLVHHGPCIYRTNNCLALYVSCRCSFCDFWDKRMDHFRSPHLVQSSDRTGYLGINFGDRFNF